MERTNLKNALLMILHCPFYDRITGASIDVSQAEMIRMRAAEHLLSDRLLSYAEEALGPVYAASGFRGGMDLSECMLAMEEAVGPLEVMPRVIPENAFYAGSRVYSRGGGDLGSFAALGSTYIGESGAVYLIRESCFDGMKDASRPSDLACTAQIIYRKAVQLKPHELSMEWLFRCGAAPEIRGKDFIVDLLSGQAD